MRYRFKILIGLGLLLSAGFSGYFLARNSIHGDFQILYSLDQKQNDQAVIDLIDHAKKYVYFAVYTFTKDNIAQALIEAKNRGVEVRGITDRGQSEESFEQPIVKKLLEAGISVETQKHLDGIMHIKAVVTDQGYASGSYNWTASATTVNDEILEIGHDAYVHGQYLKIIKKVLSDNEGSAAVAEISTAGGKTETDTAVYNYAEAGNHIGETAAVSGKVLRVYTSSGGTTFFDYCTNYKGCPFSAVVFSSSKSKFGNLSQYQGREITIKGKIQTYQGQAEIILNSPDQIIK